MNGLGNDFEASLPAVPDQKTLVLVNTFVIQTTGMLNRFSAICERKLEAVDRSIKRVDIQLQLLESKLNRSVDGVHSIEGLEGLSRPPAATPAAAPTAAPAAPAAPPAAAPAASSETAAAAPPSQPPQPAAAAPAAPPEPSVEEPEPVADFVKIKDHEDFAKFFRMERMGVPSQAVKNRMALEGIDPSLLDDPNAPAPY